MGRARRILVGVTPVGRNIAEIIDARSVSQNHLLAAKSRICECQIVQVFNGAVVPDKGAVLKIPILPEADHLTELVNAGGLAVCAAKAAEVDFLAVLQQEWGTCGCRAGTSDSPTDDLTSIVDVAGNGLFCPKGAEVGELVLTICAFLPQCRSVDGSGVESVTVKLSDDRTFIVNSIRIPVSPPKSGRGLMKPWST